VGNLLDAHLRRLERYCAPPETEGDHRPEAVAAAMTGPGRALPADIRAEVETTHEGPFIRRSNRDARGAELHRPPASVPDSPVGRRGESDPGARPRRRLRPRRHPPSPRSLSGGTRTLTIRL